jgi:pseudomonalisin
MLRQLLSPCVPVVRPPSLRKRTTPRTTHRLFLLLLLTVPVLTANPVRAQSVLAQSIPPEVNAGQPITSHHPQWANAKNDAGILPSATPLDQLTIVLARSPQQEAAFEQFLADQQDPASPSYHHWLTAEQIGQRFGPSEDATTAVTSWLQSQGLHVNWTAPSRTFIGFGGTAAAIGQAFHTEMHAYTVNGKTRISVSSEPIIPADLAIKSIRGLSTVEDKPLHSASTMNSDDPEVTTGGGNHYLAPADFNTIYDVPTGATGAGQTIGIVGRSRTDFADFDNLRQKTGVTFADPTEIVPTAFGGIDPGPAYTTQQPNSVDLDDQLEAELDVLRAGSVAPAATLLLVVATDNSGGIGADAQYLVQTSPIPADVMNISFGACELDAGSSGVNYWDNLFSQAAAEGISIFVASGDAGASGCDSYFDPPPANPEPNSPNYICSSRYDTCVGGTEFNDTADPSKYWSASSNNNLESALSYIPEGGWNEPLNSNSIPQAASSGGGISGIVEIPVWQPTTGSPTGRSSPDIAFSASGHDGYFACFAAAGASCVSTNGSYRFEYFFGTSAAAPSMAGITALLDQKLDQAQGNLNPELYALATSTPSVFHDITVASSGVTSCDINTPSMCNNSLPGPTTLTGGQSGYLLADGYDEVTGLGSIDVANFLNSYHPCRRARGRRRHSDSGVHSGRL